VLQITDLCDGDAAEYASLTSIPEGKAIDSLVAMLNFGGSDSVLARFQAGNTAGAMAKLTELLPAFASDIDDLLHVIDWWDYAYARTSPFFEPGTALEEEWALSSEIIQQTLALVDELLGDPLWHQITGRGANSDAFFDAFAAAIGGTGAQQMIDGAERADLGAIAYQPNDITLHADASLMPRRRAVWSSWNYAEARARRAGQIDITYWMNSLQPIPEDDPHFVTLNTTRPIREDLIYDQVTLRHPVYDLPAMAAQARVRAANGRRRTWFCGAWLRHGFHEDGLWSGLEVAEAILARDALPVAAE